ncbi:MAG: phospholipid-binding protein [Cyanobacteria bacterium J06554_6]
MHQTAVGVAERFTQPQASSPQSDVPIRSPLWFKAIPPERIGLNGEYDYYGLAKRVRCHLREQAGPRIIQKLKVCQRGRVVLLSGVLFSAEDLHDLTRLILSVPGVDAVETHMLRVREQALMSA